VDSRVNGKWLALELRRALSAGTLSICGPTSCHGCAPFAKECVKGVVRDTTDRALDAGLPVLSTPAAPGPGLPARAEEAPPLLPEDVRRGQRPDGAPRWRCRARFSKSGRMRFLGHLDLARALLRAMRRARIPLVYSQGFNPKPRVAFGPALSVGIRSEGEYVDFEVWRRLAADEFLASVNAALPEGLRFEAVREIRRDLPALGEAVRAARYRIEPAGDVDVPAAVERFRGRGPVTVERRKNGKVQRLELEREIVLLEALPGALRLTLGLASNGASLRPEEAVGEILGSVGPVLVVREELLVDWNGSLVDPLLAAVAAGAHGERAVP
jgi:radical SAM-linked protein